MALQSYNLISDAQARRSDLIARWEATPPATKTRAKVCVFAVVVVLAYHYSLSSLMQTVGFDTPLAYIGLVPVLAAGLAALRARPGREIPIHDRQLDYIIGVPLIAVALAVSVLGPRHMGDLYWVDRIDLLTLPVFVAGVTAILFGTRALWRQKTAILYLFLAWPWPYSTILLGTLGGFTDLTLAGLNAVLKVVPVAQAVPGIDNQGLFQVVHHGRAFPVSVVTACSGIDGMVGFFLVGAGFATIVRGPLLRKFLWLAAGLVLLWSTNLLRLVLIFWAGREWGEHVAIGILHPVAGIVIFCFGVVVMFLLLRPFGLNLVDLATLAAHQSQVDLPAPPSQPVKMAAPRIFMATALVAVAGLLLAVNNTSLRNFDPVASATGEPKLASFIAHPSSPPGWQATYENQYSINKPLFGQSSLWYRYVFTQAASHTGADLSSSLPVTADVINAGGIGGFEQYGVTACYSFHGYELRDVAQVDLGEGVSGQALSYASKNQLDDWTVVYWIWPVKMASGTRYERVILYIQNSSAGSVVLPQGNLGIKGLQNALDASNSIDRRLIVNRAFLVAFARQLIHAQVAAPGGEVTLASVESAHPTAVRTTHTTVSAAQLRRTILAEERSGKLPDGYHGISYK